MPDIGSIGSSFNISTSGVSAPGISTVGTRPTTTDGAGLDSLAPTARSSAVDRVEVSEAARWLEEMNRLPAIREDKVAAARAAIANGTLDSDENLSIALGRLIDEI